jgi:hypothetical protein
MNPGLDFAWNNWNCSSPKRLEPSPRLRQVLLNSGLLSYAETGLAMTDVAAYSLAQLEARRNALDPDQR